MTSVGDRGQASLIVLVIAMLIVFALMISYLRTSTSAASKEGPVSTLDNVKRKASAFEDQQRQHMDDLQQAVQ